MGNSNVPADWDDTTPPDTDPDRNYLRDVALVFLAPIGAAFAVAELGGRAMRLLLPNWYGVVIVSVLAIAVWVGGTYAMATWRARQEREDASGGES